MADLQHRIAVEIYNISTALDEINKVKNKENKTKDEHRLLSLADNASDIFSEFKESIKEYFTEGKEE